METSKQMGPPLVNQQSMRASELTQLAHSKLLDRASSSTNFSLEESASVSKIDHRLLPEGFEIESDISDEIRALCMLRKLPRLDSQISSHRKILGPFVVFVKKVVWKFLGGQIVNIFRQVEDFHTQIIINQIHSAVRYQELKADRK